MQDYGLTGYHPQEKPQKRGLNIIKILVLIFFVMLAIGFIKRNLGKNHSITSPLPETVISFISKKPKDYQQLLSEIRKITDSAGGTWAVYFYDLSTNQTFGINETTIFNAASINKIPILAGLYYLADKGEINLDQQITLQQGDIQDYGTGSIRYDPPGTTYSVKTLARLMMEKSDNTAAYILGRQIIGMDKVQSLIKNWGLTQTDMENDKTSLADMGRLMKKMHQGEIANQAQTTEMIGLMDESDFEDRIPAFLPKDIKIYHKTGNALGGIHDIGIINLSNHPYILGIFSSDINDETSAIQTIAQISKKVFDSVKD